MRRHLPLPLSLAALLAHAAACTSPPVWQQGTMTRADAGTPSGEETVHYSVGDVFCTTPSLEGAAPFKLLVVLDDSGSMYYDQPSGPASDPAKMRVAATKELVYSFQSDPNVSFAFLMFASVPQPLSATGDRFVNSPGELTQAFAELQTGMSSYNQGSTNYQAALQWCRNTILTDRARPGFVPNTRYGILFVTDGLPNAPAGDLATQRRLIRQAITGCEASLPAGEKPLSRMIDWLNTYYISPNPDGVAVTLLADMAQGPSADPCGENNWGHGLFTQIQDPKDLVFDIDTPLTRLTYVPSAQGLVPIPHHARIALVDGHPRLVADSDGDGLLDFQEQGATAGDWGSDPTRADTDGDGISDLVEQAAGTPANSPFPATFSRPDLAPATVEAGLGVDEGLAQASLHDQDGDGLTDAEERWFIGTDARRPDTDGDGLSDWVEVRFGLNPLDPTSAAADPDGDGVSSANEIITGMDPLHAEPAAFRQAQALRLTRGPEYAIEQTGADGETRVRNCYEFRLENIPFLPPQRADGSPGELNVLELNFLDQLRIADPTTDPVSRRQILHVRSGAGSAPFEITRTLPDHW